MVGTILHILNKTNFNFIFHFFITLFAKNILISIPLFVYIMVFVLQFDWF